MLAIDLSFGKIAGRERCQEWLLSIFFRFYEFLWRRNKGADLENLFQGLPISLQADITLSLYKDIIESVCLVFNYLNHENAIFFCFRNKFG